MEQDNGQRLKRRLRVSRIGGGYGVSLGLKTGRSTSIAGTHMGTSAVGVIFSWPIHGSLPEPRTGTKAQGGEAEWRQGLVDDRDPLPIWGPEF